MTADVGATASGTPRLEVVFILSANRSGSTWLNLVLGSHSWAANVGEIFRPFLLPGHVVCRPCEADGLGRCPVLGGIEDAGPDDCHRFAARRFGRDCIVDASKRLDWAERFVGRPDLDVRLVHLVRHPAGYAWSERLRRPETEIDGLFEEWRRVNRGIEEFTSQAGEPSAVFAYDDLADAATTEMPRLCAFLGRTFEPAALEYWRFEHHGLGANGAASLHLAGRARRNWETSDDAFYESLRDRPLAADDRWRAGLAPDVVARMVGDAYAVGLRERIGGGAWLR